MIRFWKILSYVCFVVGLVGFAANYNYATHYGLFNPTIPDPQSGRVYPHNWKSKVVYLSEDELLIVRLTEGAIYIGVIGFLVAGSLGGLFRAKK